MYQRMVKMDKIQLKQAWRNLQAIKRAIYTDSLPLPLEPMSDDRLDAKCSVENLIILIEDQIEYLEVREKDEA